MKKALLIAALLLTSCVKKETVTIPANSPFDNTQNEQQLEALRQALQLNTNNDILLEARVTALEESLAAEEQARIDGDEELADQIAALNTSITNSVSLLNTNLTNYINQQISTVNGNTASLTARIVALEALNNLISQLSTRVTNLELNTVTDAELDAYKAYVNATYATKQMLDATEGRLTSLTARVVLLEGQVSTLQSLVGSGSQVTMVKAPCATAKEVLIRVGSKYYSVLNISEVKKNQEDDDKDDNRNEKDHSAYLGELAQNVSYTTTDGTECKFKVNSNNNLQEL